MKKLLHPNVLRLFEVLDDPKVGDVFLSLFSVSVRWFAIRFACTTAAAPNYLRSYAYPVHGK
jgi:hypothetical protein